MKKLISLALALALVLCLATAVSAATTGSGESATDPLRSDNMEPLNVTIVGAGPGAIGYLYVSFPDEADGYTVTITSVTTDDVEAGSYKVVNNGNENYALEPGVSCDENGVVETTYDKAVGYIYVETTISEHEITITLTPPSQEIYSGSVAAEGWNPGVVIPFVAPGNGVVTITVSNADPGYEVGEINSGTWHQGGASGTHTFDVEAGGEYEFQLWGHDGISNCSATYDVVVTYTGEGTVTPYVPPVPGESMDDPLSFYMPAGSVTVPAGGTVYCLYTPMMLGQDDMVLTVTGPTGFMAAGFPMMGMPNTAIDTAGTATVTVPYNRQYGGYMFAVVNDTDSEQTYNFTLAKPLGSESNPAELVMGTNTATMPGSFSGYFYLWTAEADGTLTITMPETGWTYLIQINGEGTTGQLYSDDETVVGEQILTVEAYDQIIIWVNSYDSANMFDPNPAVELSFEASFECPLGSYENPIPVLSLYDLVGIDAAPGETYYVISSMLAGKELFIVDDENLTFYLNGEKLEAVNGEITAVINPVGPSVQLKVVNETDEEIETMAGLQDPEGSEGNPIVVTPMVSEVEVETAAGESSYLMVPAMCNGSYVVIEGEDLTVIVNGTAVEAKNGVYAVELTGVPSNTIVVTNAGDAAVSYTVSVVSDNPNTGDNALLSVAAALLLTSACAIALVGKKKEF